MSKPRATSRKSSTKRSKKASSAAKSPASSRKTSRAGTATPADNFVETPTKDLPAWIQKRSRLSRATLKDLAKRRGKGLKVVKGVDMDGI